VASASGLEAEIKALIVEALELAMALEGRYGVAIERGPERNQGSCSARSPR
jgi:hypothetical protein